MTGEFGGLSVDRRDLGFGSDGSSEEIGAVEQTEPAGEWSDGLEPFGVTAWELPGQGKSGSKCNEWYASAVCETCGRLDLGTHTCGRRSCPDCWGAWAKEASVRAATRVQAFRYTQSGWRRQVAHAVVSPPEGEVRTEREYWDGRSKAAEIAEEKGWRGFAVIPHPKRVTDDGKERYRAEDPDYGIWVWLRNDVEDMDRYTKWSPHYHVIGATGADMDPAKESDEWRYSFFRSLERFEGVRDRGSHEDVYGTFRYLLSHTGYPTGSTKQATTWYGDLANSVFVEDATEDWQNEKPSEGVRSALEREIEAVAGPSDEGDESDESAEREDTDDEGPCPVDGCDGLLIDVFDVSRYLDYNDPPPEVAERMRTARDWRLGRVEPPPGLKRPTTEEQAREAFESLL